MSVSLNDRPNKVTVSGDSVTVTTGSGVQGPQGATGATGAGGTVAYFGNFFSTETQPNVSVSAANTFTLNSTVDSNGVSIVDGSKITFAAGSDGTYDLQFSVQFDKTDSGTDEVDVWLSKNGTDEDWSNTVLSLVGNNAKVVAAWNFQLNDVEGGDFFQLHWWSPDTSMRALATAAGSNPTRPAVPSLIVTVAQVTYTQAGAAGAAATVAVGTTTTGAAGSSASVVNSGTSSAAVLDFTIPRGDTGATGPTGPEGGTSTLTTKGDLLTRTSSAVARLPVGATDGHILTVDAAQATGMKWAAAPASGIPATLIDAKGDLIVGSAADTAARLAVGTTGYLLAADSTATNGVTYAYNQVSQRAPQLLAANSYGIPGLVATNFNSNTGGIGVNQLHSAPFIVARPLTITKIAMRNIGAISSNTTVRCGIYASDSNGLPTGNTLITSDLSFPNPTNAGTTVVNTVSLVLNPGLYWQVIVYTSGTTNLSWHAWLGTHFNAIGVPNTGGQAGNGGFVNFTYGTLPTGSTVPTTGRGFYFTFYDWTWL